MLAPLVTYALIFVSGTQHVIYALLPIIAEVSRKAGIRPERPLSVSVIAAQQGLTASPVSAVTVALVGALSGSAIGLPQILLVTIPATLVGVAAGILVVFRRGVELADDPEYQPARRRGQDQRRWRGAARLEGAARRNAIGSCLVFLVRDRARRAARALPGAAPERRHGRAIMIVMLAAAGAIFLLFGASAEAAVKGGVMKGGLVAFVSILGVSWLGSSFFAANETAIVGAMSSLVTERPWLVRALPVRALHPADEPGRDDRHARAGRGRDRPAAGALPRRVSRRERDVLPADLRDRARGGVARSDRHDADRQVRGEPQLHACPAW